MDDNATRRQLRFAVFLQAFAALMLGGAAIVRIAAFGLDPIAAILLAGAAAVLLAIWFTVTRIRILGGNHRV